MAKAKVNDLKSFKRKPKVRRPGRHSKNNTSRSKKSKNYQKKYKGQGR